MKNYYLRTCVALACAIGLAGCGGSNNNLVLQVQIYGLTKDGLTLQNNEDPVQAVPANTSLYNFTNLVGEDTGYDIKIKTQPSNAVCTISNGTGKTGSLSPSGILISCVAYTFDLGGKISNLTTDGLILSNGHVQKKIDHTSVVAGNEMAFNMTIPGSPAVAAVPATATTPAVPAVLAIPDVGKVAEDQPYGVLIFQQPAQGTCVIQKDAATGISTGVGTMPAHAVDTIVIKC